MSEETFRIIITIGVALAALAFIIQACVMIALYKVSRKTQATAEGLVTKVQPLLAKAGPAIEHADVIIQKAGPVIERIGPTIDRLQPVIDRAGVAIEKSGPLIQETLSIAKKTSAFIDKTNDMAETANLLMRDARPHVAEISRQASEISRIGREQIEQLGELVHDAGSKARARLDQIDHSVDATIEQVEQVSGSVKRAVMKPVREVNGLAAGISAAVSTLVRGHRRSSVDSATQDEEMFI
jgi:uncharacterized protein YoxC